MYKEHCLVLLELFVPSVVELPNIWECVCLVFEWSVILIEDWLEVGCACWILNAFTFVCILCSWNGSYFLSQIVHVLFYVCLNPYKGLNDDWWLLVFGGDFLFLVVKQLVWFSCTTVCCICFCAYFIFGCSFVVVIN